MKPLLAMNIALGALLFGLLPVSSPAAHAGGISINAPGVSINIGSRDRRGYYWDGYEWRSPDWWKHRKGYYGHRNRHGYYWDGGRWRDRGWWNKHHHHRPPPPRPHPPHHGGNHGHHGKPRPPGEPGHHHR